MPKKKSNKKRIDKNKVRSASTSAQPKEIKVETKKARSSTFNLIFPFVLIVIAILVLLCEVLPGIMGIMGQGINWFLFGILSWGCFSIPIILVLIAVFWRKDAAEHGWRKKIIFGLLCTFFISTLPYVFDYLNIYGDAFDFPQFYTAGMAHVGGGVIGNSLGWLICKLLGKPGCVIISIALIFLFAISMFGKTPFSIFLTIRYKIHNYREAKREENERLMEDFRARELEREKEEAKQRKTRKDNVIPPQDVNPNPTVIEEDDGYDDNLPMIDPDLEGISEDDSSEVTEADYGFENDLPKVDEDVFEEAKKEESKAVEEPKKEIDYSSIPFEADAGAELSDTDEEFADGDSINPDKTKFRSEDEIFNTVIGEMNEDISDDDGFVDATKIGDKSQPISEDIIKKVQDELNQSAPDASHDGDIINGEDYMLDEKVEYIFPPIPLLTIGSNPENRDISEELQTTAKRLVDTLNSFKVKTKIINVSRGPTITRYELMPEEGTRVRQILNLVDDIALNLATSGVRIEAPIPGKMAVGIEVPNRTVATVWLKELIDTPKFRDAQSKLTVCLGKDVAGDPVYVDIAKTPHLLIAGATGMGKSVCINSMIISMLYKATPDELKLILIDPKKVELNMYNGLPNLLVPVVSDSKKAAGALAWSVGEMERRYSLIEDAGARDYKSYNAMTANDPEKEYLPQIVIVIDELADLMMMARDSVEESICRIAQKARAAGMHLIIGTQRPSVNVVTGLIKANVPSRIAFTMSSQVDSRTVIDVAGAEKLIGRGDMLFSPVGAMKPMRVQGAFVSDSDIDAVLSFIKNNCGQNHYNSEVISSIDKEAEKYIKKDPNAEGDEDIPSEGMDNQLKVAIELAVEARKISTSLMQRKMHIGYGKAASLIDKMEELGIVSAPDGQKPREVLITKEEFMEMILKGETFV